MQKISKELQSKMRLLRKLGLTHRQISKKLKLGLGTVHLYTQRIILTPKRQAIIKRINYKKSLGKLTSEQLLAASIKGGKNRAKQIIKTYTKDTIIALINKFFYTNGRVPFKKEFPHEKVARREFQSWNKAIIAAGYVPNPVKFSKKHVASDGHICDSLAEKIIDD